MAWPCASAGARSWRAVGGLAIPLLLAGWLLAAGASASPTQQLLIEDEHHLLELSHAEQLRALDQMQALGVDKIRAVIWWRYLLADPGARTKPRGALADPDSPLYNRSHWAMLDSLVSETRRRGIALMLDPASASGLAGTKLHLPRWARSRDGSPRVRRFALFVKAIGLRYSGRYPAAGGRRLPAVHEWSVWNEPNSQPFLTPQWRRVDGEPVPWSPVLYRRIYNAAARALRSSGHESDRIYFGETSASGSDRPFSSIAPATFVRELTCVGPDLQPYRGAEARRRQCDGYRPLDTDGLATHLYSGVDGTLPALQLGPNQSTWIPSDPARPAGVLGQIAARGRLPSDLPVYNTEAGFQSHPARATLLSESQQAIDLNIAEYLQWRDPSVASFAQYLLYDDPAWFTGLRFINGPAKQAYFAFRMPIVVRDLDNGLVEVWGASFRRGPGRPTEILANGFPATVQVPSNPRGYYHVVLRASDATSFQAVDVLSGYRSRVATMTPGL
jgi:hypothetical protein